MKTITFLVRIEIDNDNDNRDTVARFGRALSGALVEDEDAIEIEIQQQHEDES